MAYGRDANEIRKALLKRGWVEKLPPPQLTSRLGIKSSKANIETALLSSFLENFDPNFVWAGKVSSKQQGKFDEFDEFLSNKRIKKLKYGGVKGTYRSEGIVRSRLKVKVKLWSSKTGLCTSLKGTSWHYIENVAEVDAPRTYINTEQDDLIDFINDYLLTACTGLLRWILVNLQNGGSIFKRTGDIPINVMIFAMNRCKEYINIKENKDIDGHKGRVITSGQWNSFLMKYHSLIKGQKDFKLNSEQNLPLLVMYANYLLEKISVYRPQMKCEGCCNIWIIKPSNMSMGVGISLSSDLNRILQMITRTTQKYVVQKYIGKNYLLYSSKIMLFVPFGIIMSYVINNTSKH